MKCVFLPGHGMRTACQNSARPLVCATPFSTLTAISVGDVAHWSFDMTMESSTHSSHIRHLQPEIEFSGILLECTGAPADRPHWGSALRSTLHALQGLAGLFPALSALLTHVHEQVSLEGRAEVSHRNPLQGRMEGHLLYSTLLKLDALTVISQEHWKPVMTTLGAWLLRRYLNGAEPRPSSLRNLVLALSGRGMQAEALARMQARGLNSLREAIAEVPAKAALLGLCEPPVKNTPIGEPSARFRIGFQRHFSQLIKYAGERSVQGTQGHGALSSSGLRQVGVRLRSGVEAGEDLAMAQCLQARTWLTPELLKALPLVDGAVPEGLAAWINLKTGMYCYQLDLIVELREDVNEATRDCYMPASKIVMVPLPPFCLRALRERNKLQRNLNSLLTVGDLIQVDDTSPRSSILESEGYRITMRRLQESIAPVALEAGHRRWPVALATGAFWLVSRGRRAYSVCSSDRIWSAVQEIHKALGWDTGRPQLEAPPAVFVGSAVCPRSDAMARVLAFLESQCAAHRQQPNHEWLNWIAAKTSFITCLALALRSSVKYPLDWLALASRDEICFTDKHVHEQDSDPLPVVSCLTHTMQEWNAAVPLVLAHESHSVQGQNRHWVEQVSAMSKEGKYPVGEVLFSAVWQPASTDTWRLRLPPSLRLVPNFGRHFWPWALEEHGLHQKLVDLLMRHQTTYLPQSGADVYMSPARQRAKLRQVMEKVLVDIWAQVEVQQ